MPRQWSAAVKAEHRQIALNMSPDQLNTYFKAVLRGGGADSGGIKPQALADALESSQLGMSSEDVNIFMANVTPSCTGYLQLEDKVTSSKCTAMIRDILKGIAVNPITHAAAATPSLYSTSMNWPSAQQERKFIPGLKDKLGALRQKLGTLKRKPTGMPVSAMKVLHDHSPRLAQLSSEASHLRQDISGTRRTDGKQAATKLAFDAAASREPAAETGPTSCAPCLLYTSPSPRDS
eukprot:TRINITY_DN6108_c0_g1_i1.p1 TRINITY_DN6108_c0_g1~~TRINITY_DN6108_c0_g1_i1.p1  ORF type:complete len:235 (+),score=50.42 TRINITY_DN6108_c0_g1_i1:234-938(+)